MESKLAPKIKEPEQHHREQKLTHILLPILITAAVCLAGFLVLLITASDGSSSTLQWANISIMFLILPLLFVGIAVVLILVLLGNLTKSWNQSLPPGLRNLRYRIISFTMRIQELAQKPARPVIGVKSTWAAIKSLFIK